MPKDKQDIQSESQSSRSGDCAEAVCSVWNEVEIKFNDKLLLHCTTTVNRPENQKEIHDLLREIIAFGESPDVPDKEVLGKYSPNTCVSHGTKGNANE